MNVLSSHILQVGFSIFTPVVESIGLARPIRMIDCCWKKKESYLSIRFIRADQQQSEQQLAIDASAQLLDCLSFLQEQLHAAFFAPVCHQVTEDEEHWLTYFSHPPQRDALLKLQQKLLAAVPTDSGR